MSRIANFVVWLSGASAALGVLFYAIGFLASSAHFSVLLPESLSRDIIAGRPLLPLVVQGALYLQYTALDIFYACADYLQGLRGTLGKAVDMDREGWVLVTLLVVIGFLLLFALRRIFAGFLFWPLFALMFGAFIWLFVEWSLVYSGIQSFNGAQNILAGTTFANDLFVSPNMESKQNRDFRALLCRGKDSLGRYRHTAFLLSLYLSCMWLLALLFRRIASARRRHLNGAHSGTATPATAASSRLDLLPEQASASPFRLTTFFIWPAATFTVLSFGFALPLLYGVLVIPMQFPELAISIADKEYGGQKLSGFFLATNDREYIIWEPASRRVHLVPFAKVFFTEITSDKPFTALKPEFHKFCDSGLAQ